jgi:antitoxin component YwqK of YwqJK toxin-antitoxin module
MYKIVLLLILITIMTSLSFEFFQYLTKEIKTYYDNKQLHIHSYKNKRGPEYIEYYPNGNVYIHAYNYNFDNDNLECKAYREDSILIEHGFYKSNNRKHGEYKQYSKGKLFQHCFYKNNQKHGEYKQYSSNNQLEYHCLYENDRITKYKKYRDGKIYENCLYNNGNLDGIHKYYENGILNRYRYYIDNKLICELNFKITFALLKFKDRLKSKVRKPKYELLDKYFISDISNIIISYMYTLSSLNIKGKRTAITL